MNAGAPFQSFLGAMARTGVLISRHGPLLANSMFLPPGVPRRYTLNSILGRANSMFLPGGASQATGAVMLL